MRIPNNMFTRTENGFWKAHMSGSHIVFEQEYKDYVPGTDLVRFHWFKYKDEEKERGWIENIGFGALGAEIFFIGLVMMRVDRKLKRSRVKKWR